MYVIQTVPHKTTQNEQLHVHPHPLLCSPASVDCQWIDVTNVPNGQYLLKVNVNAPDENGERLAELDYSNNEHTIPVTLADVGTKARMPLLPCCLPLPLFRQSYVLLCFAPPTLTVCAAGEWSPWGLCSATCGGGTHVRFRQVSSPGCMDNFESEPCNTHDCGSSQYDPEGRCGANSPTGASCPPQQCCNQFGFCAIACGDSGSTDGSTDGSSGDGSSSSSDSGSSSGSDGGSGGSIGEMCFGCFHGSSGPCKVPSNSVCFAYSDEYYKTCPPGAVRCEVSVPDEDCIHSQWTSWGACDDQCQQVRTRDVQVPAHGNGADCEPPFSESRACEGDCVPVVDCQLGAWGGWSACDGSCKRSRTRGVATPASGGGKDCEGALSQQGDCGEECTPDTDCKLTEWSAWGACDDDCRQARTRSVETPAAGAGSPCSGAQEESRECGDPCVPVPDVDCVLGEWGAWGACDSTCARKRQRVVEVPQSGKGAPCVGSLDEVHACSSPCVPDVNCAMTEWSAWGGCNEACMRSRSRSVEVPQSGNGLACPAEVEQEESCGALCLKSDCVADEWGAWGDCTAQCGGGVQVRTRGILAAATGGGTPCSDLVEQRSCNQGPCATGAATPCTACWYGTGGYCQGTNTVCYNYFPGTSVCPGGTYICTDGPSGANCVLNAWSPWSECSAACDTGFQYRTRSVATPASGADGKCDGALLQERSCTLQSCDTGGGSDGSSSSSSDGSSDSGSSTGSGSGSDGGIVVPDDVNCLLGAWSSWSACDASCGGGKQSRSRSVLVQPSGNGAACEATVQESSCNTSPCAPPDTSEGCGVCFPGTSGPCRAYNSVCFSFIGGTAVCPAGTVQCAVVAAAALGDEVAAALVGGVEAAAAAAAAMMAPPSKVLVEMVLVGPDMEDMDSGGTQVLVEQLAMAVGASPAAVQVVSVEQGPDVGEASASLGNSDERRRRRQLHGGISLDDVPLGTPTVFVALQLVTTADPGAAMDEALLSADGTPTTVAAVGGVAVDAAPPELLAALLQKAVLDAQVARLLHSAGLPVLMVTLDPAAVAVVNRNGAADRPVADVFVRNAGDGDAADTPAAPASMEAPTTTTSGGPRDGSEAGSMTAWVGVAVVGLAVLGVAAMVAVVATMRWRRRRTWTTSVVKLRSNVTMVQAQGVEVATTQQELPRGPILGSAWA